jgi:hypothetical protein
MRPRAVPWYGLSTVVAVVVVVSLFAVGVVFESMIVSQSHVIRGLPFQ